MKNLLIALLLCSTAFAASYTTVSATLQDSSTQVWANAQWTAEFSRPNGNNLNFLNQGVAITPNQTGTADGSGHFTVVLDDNLVVSPAGSGWKFTICPNASVTFCNSIVLTITGATQNISSQLNAVLTPPSVGATPSITRAYSTSEANGSFGTLFINSITNVLSQCLQIFCSGTGWVSVSAGTGVTSFNGRTGVVTSIATDYQNIDNVAISDTLGNIVQVDTSNNGISISGNDAVSLISQGGASLNLGDSTPTDSFSLSAITGAVTSSGNDLTLHGSSGVFAPTPLTADNSTKVATTAFVKAQNYGTVTSVSGTGQGNETVVSSVVTPITTSGNIRASLKFVTKSGNVSFADSDRGQLFLSNDASDDTYTLPQPTSTTFQNGWYIAVKNGSSTNNLIFTPTSATIDGSATITMLPHTVILIESDGTNYHSGFVSPVGNNPTNLVFASPNGSTGLPQMRALVTADLPTSGTWNFAGTLNSSGTLTTPQASSGSLAANTTAASLQASSAGVGVMGIGNGTNTTFLRQMLYRAINPSVQTNPTAYTSLLSSPTAHQGTLTLPANMVVAGNVLHFKAIGSITIGTAGSVNFQGTLGGTSTGQFTQITANVATTAIWFEADLYIYCTTGGASGAITTNNKFVIYTSGTNAIYSGQSENNTSTFAFNGSLAFDFQMKFGTSNGGNAIQVLYASLEEF